MKNNIYFLIRTLFISLLFSLLLPFHSFAQSLAPIPDVGEGVCVANCPGDTPDIPTPTSTPASIVCPNDCSGNGSCILEACFCSVEWEGDDCSIPKPTPTESTQSHLENAKELNMQALEELNEGKYVEASITIDNTIESLNNVKDSLETDPTVLQFCENKPKTIEKIERSIQSSINNHNKAALVIDRIIEVTSAANRTNNNPAGNKTEELLQKLVKFAKRFLTRPIRVSNSFAVCGVRG